MTNYMVLDIGNTQIKCGLFQNEKLISVAHYKTSDTAKIMDQIKPNSAVLLCSVVPQVSIELTSQLQSNGINFKTIVLNDSVLPGIYPGMGVDRFANAVAGAKHYGKNNGAIVIDLGTATTLSAVLPNGTFAGGYITLGLGTTLTSLSQKTAQLPELFVSDQTVQTGKLGLDTQSAILDGSVLGHLGLIDAWIKSAKKAVGQDAPVVVTGGLSRYLGQQSKFWDYLDPDLTLKGIFLINALETVLKDPV